MSVHTYIFSRFQAKMVWWGVHKVLKVDKPWTWKSSRRGCSTALCLHEITCINKEASSGQTSKRSFAPSNSDGLCRLVLFLHNLWLIYCVGKQRRVSILVSAHSPPWIVCVLQIQGVQVSLTSNRSKSSANSTILVVRPHAFLALASLQDPASLDTKRIQLEAVTRHRDRVAKLPVLSQQA